MLKEVDYVHEHCSQKEIDSHMKDIFENDRLNIIN